tara:strand:+ start:542 stop:1198 length:657 start_codon:yes stop_codon:yes gene_type:complete
MKRSFKDIGENTDKVYEHGYDNIYPMFLESLRDQEFNMLEIGVNKGSSIKLWGEYFPHSKIYGVDIDSEWSNERCTTYKFDQSNPKDLKQIVKTIPDCKFIIDDGSHIPYHQIITFHELFNNLLEYGGVYIIEDIECSYWRSEAKIYGYEIGHFNIVDYFKNKTDQINDKITLNKNRMNISTITFGYNCIVITKKTKREVESNSRVYEHSHMLNIKNK